MKTSWLSFFLILLSAIGTVHAVGKISIDATLDVEHREIQGRMTVQLDPLTEAGDYLLFRLYPNRAEYSGDSLQHTITIDSVFAGGERCTVKEQSEPSYAEVLLPGSVRAGDSVSATLFFEVHIPKDRARLGFAHDIFTLEAWFPMPARYVNGNWERLVYDRNAEPVAEFFDIDVIFRTEKSWQVIAPGIQRIDTTSDIQAVHASLHPSHDFGIVVAKDMLVLEAACDSVRTQVFFRRSERLVADTIQAVVCHTIRYMSAEAGPYPYKEFIAVVGAYYGDGALELPAMILLYKPGNELFSRMIQMTVLHETVHQWFYGLLASNQAEEPWLDEAVTEYFTEKLNHREADGRGDYLDGFGWSLDLTTLHRAVSHRIWEERRLDLPSYTYGERSYFRAVYGKGALVLKTLTSLMGPDNERDFWHGYVNDFSFKYPTRADFVTRAAVYLPNTDTALVSGMISTTEATDFSVESLSSHLEESAADSQRVSPDQYTVRIVVRALHPPGYPVDLHLDCVDGTSRDTTLVLGNGKQEIRFDNCARAVAAVIDPEYKYALDRNYFNNSIQLTGGEANGPRLFSGALYMIESLLSSLWGW